MQFLTLMMLIVLSNSALYAGSIHGSINLHDSVEKNNIDLSQQVVRLSIYKNNQEIAGAEIKCDEQGQFSFYNLEDTPEFSYLYYTIFQGVPYVGETIRFNENQKTLQLNPILVYESTQDLSAIQSSETIFFSIGDNDVMKVVQQVRLINNGQKTYHYDAKQASGGIVYQLISGAYDLRFINGIYTATFDVNEEAESLSFKEDLFPGEDNARSLKFSYLVPIKSRNKTHVNTMAIARKNINVFIDHQGVKFTADPLQKQNNMQMFGKTQQLYKGGPIPANTPLNFEFKGLPTTAMFTLKIIVYGSIFALLMFLGLMVYDKKTKITPQEKKERLYQSLLELDKKFKENKINQPLYDKQKNILMQYLVYFEKQNHES